MIFSTHQGSRESSVDLNANYNNILHPSLYCFCVFSDTRCGSIIVTRSPPPHVNMTWFTTQTAFFVLGGIFFLCCKGLSKSRMRVDPCTRIHWKDCTQLQPSNFLILVYCLFYCGESCPSSILNLWYFRYYYLLQWNTLEKEYWLKLYII